MLYKYDKVNLVFRPIVTTRGVASGLALATALFGFGLYGVDNVDERIYENILNVNVTDAALPDDLGLQTSDFSATQAPLGVKTSDDSYAAALLEYGHKGYADYTNEELASELRELLIQDILTLVLNHSIRRFIVK